MVILVSLQLHFQNEIMTKQVNVYELCWQEAVKITYTYSHLSENYNKIIWKLKWGCDLSIA